MALVDSLANKKGRAGWYGLLALLFPISVLITIPLMLLSPANEKSLHSRAKLFASLRCVYCGSKVGWRKRACPQCDREVPDPLPEKAIQASVARLRNMGSWWGWLSIYAVLFVAWLIGLGILASQ